MAIDVSLTTQYSVDGAQIQSVSASGTYAHSVMTKAGVQMNNTSVSSGEGANENVSNLDALLQKLCAELKISGLTPEELKNSGILFKISGMNSQEMANCTEPELNRIIDCLKVALKDCESNGKIDLEKAGQLGNKYYIALCTGWDSIEKYKNNSKGESLSARMERFFGLDKKGIKFSELPQAKIEEYLKRYFNEFFVEKLKNAKTPEEKAKIYKTQLQDFGKLLNNTPDSEKAVFKQAISSLCATNRVKGLDAVLKSFATPQARTEWANSWSVDEIQQVLTEADVEGNVMEKDEATAFSASITKNSSAETVKSRHEVHNTEAKAFFEENKEALEIVAQKEAAGEELTPEEKELKTQRDNYYTAFKAGEIAGVALNETIEQKAKSILLHSMNKDVYELPIYKDVLKDISAYIKKHPETLTIPEKDLKKLLDEITNGNYTIVDSDSEAVLNPPKSAETFVYAPKYTAEDIQQKQQEIRLMQQQIALNSDEASDFEVEKEAPRTYVTRDNNTLSSKLAGKCNKDKLTYIVKNIGNFSYGQKLKIGQGFKSLGHTNLMAVLTKISNDNFILALYKHLDLSLEDVDKLNVSTAAKNIMKNELQKQEEAV